jgi:mannosidase alpha-like ER degradation enhancer 2
MEANIPREFSTRDMRPDFDCRPADHRAEFSAGKVIAEIGGYHILRFFVLSACLLLALIVPFPSRATNTQTKASAQPPSKAAAMSSAEKAQMADAIRGQFLHAWNGYRKYAWGHDQLKPLSRSSYDWYGVSLEMTPVDALDTMLLMGLKKQADSARELIDKNLSFDRDISVENFEITIRILGGLESSYEMTGDKRLLALAEDLGNRLLPAFHSPTGMPYRFVNLKTGAVRGNVSNPAEIGSLTLEFGTLSKLTGKPVYFDTAKRAVVALYNRRSPIGLVGSQINVETGQWVNPDSFIGGGIDSYYEYLLKAWLSFGDKDFERMWKSSVAAVNRYVAQDAPSGFWYGEVNMNTGVRTGTEFGALEAFWPGTLALSGDLDRARRLEDSCFKMWNLYGVEPDGLDYSSMKVTYPSYPLRPEIIESAFYLYRFTGDPRYLRMGRTFYDSIVKYCRTDSGFASLKDVLTKQKADAMPSYFLAETLKYLYLLFAPPEKLDLNKVVFNTEAHPLRKSP